jgi:hypothetical protein
MLVIPLRAKEIQPLGRAAQSRSPKRVVAAISPLKKVGITTTSQLIRYKGEKLLVLRTRSSEGLVVGQLVMGNSYTEIIYDSNHNGKADVHEVRKGPLRVRATSPIRGEFARLEVEERTQKGLVRSKFLLTPDRRQYRLISVRLEPYRIEASTFDGFQPNVNDIVVGQRCRAGDPVGEFAQKWRDILEAHAAGNEGGPSLSEMMDRTFFHESCRKEPFLSTYQEMRGALEDVILSSASSNQSPGRYLQCLQSLNLNTHKMRIEESLWSEHFRATSLGRQGHEMIRCEASRDPKLQGSYDQQERKITLHKPLMTNRTPSGLTPRQSYAGTIFHELAHLSQIGDESLVDSIELCCAHPNSAQAESGCKQAKSIISIEAVRQNYEAMMSQLPGFSDALVAIEYGFEATSSRSLQDDLYGEIERGAGGRIAVFEQCLRHPKKDEAECQAEFQRELLDSTEAFFRKRCEREKANKNTFHDDAADCSSLAAVVGQAASKITPQMLTFDDNVLQAIGRDGRAMATDVGSTTTWSESTAQSTQPILIIKDDDENRLRDASISREAFITGVDETDSSPNARAERNAIAKPSLERSQNSMEDDRSTGPLSGGSVNRVLNASSPVDMPDSQPLRDTALSNTALSRSEAMIGEVGAPGDIPRGELGKFGEREDLAESGNRSTKIVDALSRAASWVGNQISPAAKAAEAPAAANQARGNLRPANRSFFLPNPYQSQTRNVESSVPRTGDEDLDPPAPSLQVGAMSNVKSAAQEASEGSLNKSQKDAKLAAEGTGVSPLTDGESDGTRGRAPAAVKALDLSGEARSRQNRQKRLDEQAVRAFLIGDYAVFDTQLRDARQRQELSRALVQYQIKVIDREGKVHGHRDPKTTLRYCPRTTSLVLDGQC